MEGDFGLDWFGMSISHEQKIPHSLLESCVSKKPGIEWLQKKVKDLLVGKYCQIFNTCRAFR